MKEYSNKYPEFGFEKNKGYGTKFHLNALKNNRPSPIHRMTFKPIRKKWINFIIAYIIITEVFI